MRTLAHEKISFIAHILWCVRLFMSYRKWIFISAKLLTEKLSACLEAAGIKPEVCSVSKKNLHLLNIIFLLKLLNMRQTTTSTTRVLPRFERRLQRGRFLILRVTKLKRFGDTVADWQEWKLSFSQRADSASVVVLPPPPPTDPRLITNARMPPLCRRCTDG